jgi:hypothetical protein
MSWHDGGKQITWYSGKDGNDCQDKWGLKASYFLYLKEEVPT